MIKHHQVTDRNSAMTLFELLVVIAVVGILVALLFPALRGRGHPGISRVSIEIRTLEYAIESYHLFYQRWPISTNIELSGMADFTFGTAGMEASMTVTNGGILEANNSELLSITMDLRSFRNGNPTLNHDGSLNPRHMAFLNAKTSEENKSGVGVDGVYRDPWGNPYIITIDLDGDEKCRDAFYSQPSVSAFADNPKGHHGLIRQTNSSGKTVYVSTNRVMVWSFGPDGKADANIEADRGVNKDNVLSWHQ